MRRPFQLALPGPNLYHNCHPFRSEKKILFCFRLLCFIPFNKSIVFFPSSTILFRSLFPALPSSLLLSSICHFHLPSFTAPLSIFPAILCPLPPSSPLHSRTPSLFSVPSIHISHPLSPSPLLTLLQPRR